jgi:hypothetical protein
MCVEAGILVAGVLDDRTSLRNDKFTEWQGPREKTADDHGDISPCRIIVHEIPQARSYRLHGREAEGHTHTHTHTHTRTHTERERERERERGRGSSSGRERDEREEGDGQQVG